MTTPRPALSAAEIARIEAELPRLQTAERDALGRLFRLHISGEGHRKTVRLTPHRSAADPATEAIAITALRTIAATTEPHALAAIIAQEALAKCESAQGRRSLGG